ncbi:MAG TPA: hypothetical protein VM364_20990 [Vicinamibacterales bacterium]|nr:hypothetical protein [Vicinamibacterales bacterium]
MSAGLLSESVLMSSAAQARFRVQAPNSLPRAIKVVALDPAGEAVVRRLAVSDWRHAAFFSVATFTRDLEAQVASADLVVMVAGPGGRAEAAAVIGRACSDRRVTTTALVVDAASAPEEELARTLVQIRPWSLMVVIANSDEYVEDLLVALRA